MSDDPNKPVDLAKARAKRDAGSPRTQREAMFQDMLNEADRVSDKTDKAVKTLETTLETFVKAHKQFNTDIDASASRAIANLDGRMHPVRQQLAMVEQWVPAVRKAQEDAGRKLRAGQWWSAFGYGLLAGMVMMTGIFIATWKGWL